MTRGFQTADRSIFAPAAPRVRHFSSSPFRHLIRKLSDRGLPSERDGTRAVWRPADLQLLERLPHITRICSMTISWPSSAQANKAPLAFPKQLQSVDLVFYLTSKAAGVDDYRPVMQALGACASLTDVALFDDELIAWDLTPLLELKQLRKLKLRGRPDFQFGSHAIAVVKQMASLESLQLHPLTNHPLEFDAAWLLRLCRPPHQLQRLQELDLSKVSLEDAGLQALRHLPALTALEPFAMRASAMASLVHFPGLHRLRLLPRRFGGGGEEDLGQAFFDHQGFARASTFLPHLRCIRLQVLTLCECVFTIAEAETLCTTLPQLTDLTFENVGWPSLEPLHHLTRLTELSLALTRRTPVAFELAHLQAIKSLRTLTLKDMHPPLNVATVTALTPPSLLMPALTSFEYIPRSPLLLLKTSTSTCTSLH